MSVVIPALNEATRLPALLDCLDRQTLKPSEIVVADADSTDGTPEIARARGARVVRGGKPAEGRNAGAAVATSDLILFMDADAQIVDEFIERAVAEFERRELGMATAPPRAVERGLSYRIVFPVAEAYMRLTSLITPSAIGLCMLVERSVHEGIGGFDESLVMAEDAEYARRAAHVTRFGILRSVKAFTSARRIRSYGWLHSARVILFTESRNLAGIPIRSVPFSYEFGAYEETPAGSGEGTTARDRGPA